jgi:hypothetical protein
LISPNLNVASSDSDGGRKLYRYERKFALPDEEHRRAESVLRLNPAAFSGIYYPRWVNSLYLDTLSDECLADNLSGFSEPRVKIRVRWYGDFQGPVNAPKLELKIKHGHVNRKVIYDLDHVAIDRSLSIHRLRDLIRAAKIGDGLTQDLLKLEPAVAVRYLRSYYLSVNRKFRVTIDSQLAFHRLCSSRSAFAGKWVRGPESVLELKYGVSDDLEADHITQHFPYRVSRSSKFASGLQMTQSYLGA